MRETYKVYKLLEVIEMPTGTDLHMINGDDYKINKNGELVSKDGESLPISKRNIDNCEFTIIEELKDYNFRVYRNGNLIKSFNKNNLSTKNLKILIYALINKYDETVDVGLCGSNIKSSMSKYSIDVQVEEIIGES